MQILNLNRQDRCPLLDQIVHELRSRIEAQMLRPGAKLPSIRSFAEQHRVSRSTVVEAYDKLVAMGYIRSQRGAGFFVAAADNDAVRRIPQSLARRNDEIVWLIRRLLEAHDGAILAGGPWLPEDWLDQANLRRVLRTMASNDGSHLIDYGNPFGYLPLRKHIAEAVLPEVGIRTSEDRVILTCGASQALDLVSRTLLDPGDTALVDDPGYYNLFANLRLQGVRLIGVPRRADGPDVDALDRLAAEHQPKVYFTQSVQQNPTGSTMSQHTVFRVLQSAARHDFTVVEDDIFSDLQPEPAARLAALDQLQRVIYVRSFSKTLSGSLRVGFIACSERLVEDLVNTKMVTCINTSLFTEKLIYRLLTEGYYRKFISRLLDRLGEARCNAMAGFERAGIETSCDNHRGMFVWGRFPGIEDALALAQFGLNRGLMLAPGSVFRPALQSSAWMRFNVAVCERSDVLWLLERLAAEFKGTRPRMQADEALSQPAMS
jgi:DNA-binding transcriptional MocR family regulator